MKKKKKTDDEDDYEDDMDIGELIEQERAALPSGGTKVTLETFTEWKKKYDAREAELAEAKKQELIKKGGKAAMSGKDLFAIDPSLFVDADGAESDYGDAEDFGDADLYGEDDELPSDVDD